MKKRVSILLAVALLLTSCGGGGASAATMHLRRAEGTVGVADGEGKTIEPRENLGLYSGYGVDTQTESYAWIDLDEAKLTKLDQDSEIAITKEGKSLEIEVKSGNLFFNVTEPLEDDETLNIRSSTMLVGIRGTCGWVTQDAAALLEGTVEVTAGEQTATVSAGEMALITEDGEIVVEKFSAQVIPAFVAEELVDNNNLAKAVLDDSGLDVLSPPDPMRLRDMYTFSRVSTYGVTGELGNAVYYFPDEQGRIGGYTLHDYTSGTERIIDVRYTYNEDGTLRTQESSTGITYTITENTADHRTMVREDMDMVYIDYYNELGWNTRQDLFRDGAPRAYLIYTYNAAGNLIRSEQYASDGSPVSYLLYEYD